MTEWNLSPLLRTSFLKQGNKFELLVTTEPLTDFHEI